MRDNNHKNMFQGNSPVHLDAWSKSRLGFVTPIKVEPNQPVSAVLPPVEAAPVVYRMDVPNSGGKEYFLVETGNRLGSTRGSWWCLGLSRASSREAVVWPPGILTTRS
jgi:immune inhibitor A